MIFWLCVLILVVAIVLWVIGCKEYIEGMWITGVILTFVTGIAVIIMSISLCIAYSTIDTEIAMNKELYKAITYKVESGACRDEFGLLSKEVIDEVQEWNTDVLYYQNIQDNFWVGIFYPDIYDQFETIDYTKYSKE